MNGYTLLRYTTMAGIQPTSEWINKLNDNVAAGLIRASLNRMQFGHFGKSKFVGHGIWELKIHFGPGYRVYYFKDGPNLIILLLGGEKGSQERDIRQAKIYAKDYWRRK